MDLWCLTSILQVQGLESSNWKISRLSRHEDGNQAFPIFAMKRGRAPKGNSASNHHFARTMLNFRGNETILVCDFEDSKGFQKAPHLLVGKYPSSLAPKSLPEHFLTSSKFPMQIRFIHLVASPDAAMALSIFLWLALRAFGTLRFRLPFLFLQSATATRGPLIFGSP